MNLWHLQFLHTAAQSTTPFCACQHDTCEICVNKSIDRHKEELTDRVLLVILLLC